MDKIGLYVHIPFCERKCPYCDFYSVRLDENLLDRYIETVCLEMESYKEKDVAADTLYFGGGTPGLMSPRHAEKVIEKAREVFSLDGEITLEANPHSMDREKLVGMKNAGINRLSFGVQSMTDGELNALGRLHDVQKAKETVFLAKECGFDNISCDLMLGVPYQTKTSALYSIEEMAKLPITHISAYMLKVEEGTRYFENPILENCVGEDELSEIYLSAVESLGKKGFSQYEISNFAKKGFESRHNLKYWQCEEYLGFGAAAHSFFEGKRFFHKPDLAQYIESGGKNIEISDDNAGGADEYIMLGLRLKKGISLNKLEEKFGVSKDSVLKKAKRFVENGLMKNEGEKLSLTEKGLLISNYIIAEMM